MRKFLLLFTMLIIGISLSASTTVGFNFAELYGTATISDISSSPKTISNVTFSFAKGNSASAPAFNKVGSVRLYGGKSADVLDGNTMTVTSNGDNITTIKFSNTSTASFTMGEVSCDVGSFEDNVWTGDAKSVTFTLSRNSSNTSTSTQWHFTDASVIVGGSSGAVDPDPEPEPDPTPNPEPGTESIVAFVVSGATYPGSATETSSISGTIPGAKFTSSNVNLDYTKVNSTAANVSSNLLRWYQSDIITVTPAAGVTITKIYIPYNTTYSSTALTASEGTITVDDTNKNQTWTGEASTAFTLTAAKQMRIPYIEITYTKVDNPDAVDAPIITMGENNTVSISAAEGDIYYTTNGEDPTTASTKYTAPFTISSATTVKAIAVVNGNSSPVATKALKPNSVNSIADFISLANGEPTTINCPLTVIYKNGRNLYLTDGEEFILSYNSNDNTLTIPALTNGQQLSFIKGAYKSQNGLHEIIPSEIGEITDGTPVEPEELGIDELATDQLNRYVAIADVAITATASVNNYTATDADGNTVTIFNSFYNSAYYDVVEVPEGEGFTVIGFTNIYNSKIQITPIAFEGGVALEHVANPTFNPESGAALNIGDVVTVSSETEGATFYYTDDNSEPTADSDILANGQYIYTGGTVTLKVLAAKDGMLDSDVVSATYKEYVEGLNEVEFDFTSTGNASSLSGSTVEAGNSQTDDATNNINGIEFISGPVKLVINKAESSTNPRWWSTSDTNAHLRIYKSNVVRVQIVQDNFCLNKVEGVQGVSTAANFKNLNFTTVKTNLTPAETEAEAQAMSRAAETDGEWNNEAKEWKAAEGNKTLWVELTQDPNGSNPQFGGFKAYYASAPGLTAIDTVSIDDVNAPVEYYNLQGVRISAENFVPGIYIRRQGSKTVKVLVK